MSMTRLLILIMTVAAGTMTCKAQEWQSVELKRSITHPQPMTGLVLWPDEARSRNATYGKTIQLEFSYCLPCKVVTGCEPDGTATRLLVTNEGVAPLYRDAWFAIGDVRSETSLRGLLPGEELLIEIPAVPNAHGSDIRIACDCILPQQDIEFNADITATVIETLSYPPVRGKKPLYDLQGRQVRAEANASSLTHHPSFKKGVCIADGKKFLIGGR